MVRELSHRPSPRNDSLTSYFYRSLSDAARHRRLQAHDGTVLYVAELLTAYGDPRRLFDYEDGRVQLPALADLYRHAVETDSRRERNAFLQRLGDVALFVAGLFPGYLERRVVGVDYYIAMGQSAYRCLDGGPAPTPLVVPHSPFSELAAGFRGFVGLLSDIGRRGHRRGADQRLVERWVLDQEPVLTTRPPFPAAFRH